MVKSVQYNGSTTNTADSLFGNTSLFSTTPTKLSSTAQSLFNLEPTKPVELSPAAQSALKEMDAVQAQAEKAGERVAQIQAEQMKQQEALSKQLEAQREELARQAEERKKVEEKAAKELKEKLKSDPTMLVKADIDALLNSEAYQKAGDLRRQAMMAQKSAEIRQRLIAQGVSPEEAEASARTFESSIQSDINQFKQDAEDGWFSPVKDFFRRTAQQFNDWQAAGNIKDAGLITEAQSDLLSRGKARGWAVDEALERDPEIRKFLIRDGAIDSLSEFRLKPGLTAAQKSELKTRLENAYQGVYSDFEKNNKEATDWRAGMSAEQRREMDNFSFEAEQMSAKYDPNDDSLLTSLSKTWDSVTLAARYPTTLLTDNSGSLAVAAGSTVVNIGLTAASAVPGLNAATAPAAAAGWARTAQTVRKLSNVLINSVGNAELVEADVINSAREQIAASSVADLAKANPEQWAAMLKLTDGNEELAKQKLVTMTAVDKWGSAWLLGFASGVVGPETLISSAISRGAAKRIARDSIEGIAAQSTAQITSRNVAKNAALWSVGTLSEGAEEGFTTYFTNLATRNANGTQDLWDGFEESFGTGLAMGGMMSSVATALNTVQTVRSETELRDRAVAVAPLSDANIMAKTEQYMALGEVDFNTLRKTMMDDLTSFASNVSHAFARSPEAISAQQQMYFDTFIDNANVLERLPSSQQRELKNLAKEAFDGNININGYDRAQNTAAMQVLADSTQRPADPVLADAWRVIHGKELKQVAEPKLAEATAKLYKQLFPNGEVNETTRQRVNRTTQILRDIVNDDPSITASDKRTLLQRANVYFDASTRRAGDPNANEETKQSPQGTDSSNNGGGVQQGEPSRQGQQAEATDAGQATADSQGTRDGATRQAGEQSSGTATADGVSADAQSDVAGTREAPQVEPTTYTSGEIDVPSATPAIPGSVGQTNQTSGPDGLAVATPTPTAESGGVTGTTPTERRADGSSTTTTTTSDTLGGNDGRETTTQGGTSYDNRPFSTEVRNAQNTTIGYRAAETSEITSFQDRQFSRVTPQERGVFVRLPISALMGNPSGVERYAMMASDETLMFMRNKFSTVGAPDTGTDWVSVVDREMERRALTNVAVPTADVPLLERTTVAESAGMVLSRDGKDGIIVQDQGEFVFLPYDGSVALVMDDPAVLLSELRFTESTTPVQRNSAYLRRLKFPRTNNADSLLEQVRNSLQVGESTITFAVEPTAVKQAVVKTSEELEFALDNALGQLENVLGISTEEALDFIEFTIAGKVYNDGEFNNLTLNEQADLVTMLSAEVMHDPSYTGLGQAVRENRAQVQSEELSRRIERAGVATDMVWLDMYNRFNRDETARVHGKNDPITGTAELVKEIRSIQYANDMAQRQVIPNTMSALSPEDNVTLDTLVGHINLDVENSLLQGDKVDRIDTAMSLLGATKSVRDKRLTQYAKYVPEQERKTFRKALSTLVRNLDTAYATARTRAIAEGSAPAFKRKSVRRRISEDTQIDVPSPRLVSRQAQQETTNETQDTTGEQPTDARVATTEESADTLRDVRETDDEAGAVRGQSEEANRTAQEEPSNQVEAADVSNETAGTDTQGDGTNVSGSNQQAEPTASAVGEDTGNIRQLTATDIESATTADEVIATGTVPVANNGPVTLGDTPTEQVAIIQPLIVRGTTVDTAYTNEGQHTPAEESAQAVFDTHPITDTAEDGTTVAEIAVALADNFGVNSTEPMTPPKKLSSKKKGEPRKAVVEKFKRPESERSDRLFTNETSLANAVHNQLFKTVQEGESNQAQWLEYLVANDFEGHLAEAINSIEYLQAGIDAAMSNSSVATARAPITDYWRWDERSSNPKYKGKKYFSVEGAAQKVASHLAGITPRFDDYLNGMKNVPRSGMAQDSAKPSVSLAKISSMKTAIYGFIHTTYIDPVIKLVEDKTFKYPKNKDIGTDMGRYAKYRHALEEYGDSWLNGKNAEVAELRKKIAENETAILDIVNDIVGDLTIEDILANENSIRSTASRLSEVSRRKFNADVKEHAQRTRKLTKAEKDATNSADVWFGRVSREDFPNMKLPDGHTKAELEALIAELEATYDKADLEEVADKIYGAYAGIRTTGATYGVYDSVQLKSFNDIKYKKYVHMARGHRDKPSEFEEDIINESLFDGVDDANLVEQYKTLGLTRDLSKYKRAGSTSEVDDALTNLGRLARNIAGRAASVEFEQDIQGLFEGTLNQPVLEGKPTAEQITEFKTAIVQKGAVAGLVRIRSDLPSRLVPSEFKHLTPVLGKGWEINEKTGEYELVPYKYYFTDPVIQNELTHNVDVNNNWNTNVVTANIRTLTRWRSSFMTSRNPMWNMWNFAREFMERGVTIMFRPVVDDAGKRVSGTKLASLFAKNLSRMSVDLDLQAQIYRYLAFREMRTPAQRELHNLYTSGTIQVMTDLTDKYDFMGEQDRSALDNLANNAQKLMKRLGSKSGLTNMVNVTADQAIKWYHIRVAEVPQVVNAMAMHRAYRDAGVNMTEANHRVRDSFDPTRTKSTLVQSLSNYLPFIRSTGAGNYNTMRTLGDAFLRGSRADRAKAVLKLTLLGLSAYATVQLASAAFGDDEDGEDLVAQFDQGELNRGVPFRMSDGKVIFLPVGHGLPSMIWSFATSMHRLVNGRTDGWGVAGNVVEQFAKNSLPANAPTGDQLANSGGKAVFLNLMPAMFLPAAEIILNQTQFGSNEIVRNSTPRGERDSDQDNFNTPEVYKDMAKDIYKMTGGVVDWRPENIHHVMRSYAGVGPFRSIDAALQDKGEKTAGVFANKGERMGVFATLVGADIGISTSVMSNESRYYSLAEHKPKILQKYNVPETMTDGDTYDKVDLTGIDTSGINFDRETSAERFAHQLRAAGATDAEVQLVVNLTLADSKRKELRKEMHKAGRSVYNSTSRGTATEYTEADVFEAATALDQLYFDTVINNNQFTQRVK